MDATSTIDLHTGRTMPILGLGTSGLTHDVAGRVSYALGLGYRLIDTASDYGTHTGIGEAISSSSVDRDDLYIVMKVEATDDAFEATKQYLREINLQYADLMLIHRPPASGAGEELWEGLIRARNEGLVRDIGVSNYPAVLIEELIESSGEIPVVNQIEWSPFGHSAGIVRYCDSKDIIIQAYSPLTRATRLDDNQLVKLAAKYNKTPAQILIRWNLELGIVPLPKASERAHMEENINVFDFEIAPDDIAHLIELNELYSTSGSLPYA